MSRSPRPGSVVIANATGPNAFTVNGVYEPTLEVCCGLPAFQKKSDKDLWLEYFNSKWRILGTAGRGTNSGWAFISAERPCLPQDCNMGEWQVAVGSKHESFPAVTLTLLSAPSSDMSDIVALAQQVFDADVRTALIDK